MKLSDLIVRYRESNNISQREFARRCGLSNSLISLIEKGYNPQTGKEISPDLDTYAHLAIAMGISIQTLFERLGDDAAVKLVSLHSYPDPDNPGELYEPGVYEDPKDLELLEALHQNPRLGMLFDRVRRMSPEDQDTMIAVSASIMKERDGDD